MSEYLVLKMNQSKEEKLPKKTSEYLAQYVNNTGKTSKTNWIRIFFLSLKTWKKCPIK